MPRKPAPWYDPCREQVVREPRPCYERGPCNEDCMNCPQFIRAMKDEEKKTVRLAQKAKKR